MTQLCKVLTFFFVQGELCVSKQHVGQGKMALINNSLSASDIGLAMNTTLQVNIYTGTVLYIYTVELGYNVMKGTE